MELVSFGKVIYILNQIVHDGYKLIGTLFFDFEIWKYNHFKLTSKKIYKTFKLKSLCTQNYNTVGSTYLHNTSSKKYANNACKAHIRRILFYAKGREWQALLSNVIICLSSVIVVFSVFRKIISSCCGSIDSEHFQWNTQCSCFTSFMPSWRGDKSKSENWKLSPSIFNVAYHH